MKHKKILKITAQIGFIIVMYVALSILINKVASYIEQSNNPWFNDFRLAMLGLVLASIIVGFLKGTHTLKRRIFLLVYYGFYAMISLYLFISTFVEGLELPPWVYVSSIAMFICLELASSINYNRTDYN